MDVAIIKYNAGNIYSVDYALKRLGVTPIITADPELLNKAEVDFKAAIGNGDAMQIAQTDEQFHGVFKGA